MKMLTERKALEILKQPNRVGCNLIKANDEESCKYNQESIEAFNMAVSSVEKLAQIKQILTERGELRLKYKHPHDTIYEIEKILEQE